MAIDWLRDHLPKSDVQKEQEAESFFKSSEGIQLIAKVLKKNNLTKSPDQTIQYSILDNKLVWNIPVKPSVFKRIIRSSKPPEINYVGNLSDDAGRGGTLILREEGKVEVSCSGYYYAVGDGGILNLGKIKYLQIHDYEGAESGKFLLQK